MKTQKQFPIFLTVLIGTSPGTLSMLLTGLKLSGAISWPWLWITCPFWLPLIVAAVLFVIYTVETSWK